MLPSTHLPLLLFLLVRQGEREDPTGQNEGSGVGMEGECDRHGLLCLLTSYSPSSGILFFPSFCQATLSAGQEHLTLLLAFPEIFPNLLFSPSSLISSTPPTAPCQLLAFTHHVSHYASQFVSFRIFPTCLYFPTLSPSTMGWNTTPPMDRVMVFPS